MPPDENCRSAPEGNQCDPANLRELAVIHHQPRRNAYYDLNRERLDNGAVVLC